MIDNENNFSKISLMKTNFINHTKQTNKQKTTYSLCRKYYKIIAIERLRKQ